VATKTSSESQCSARTEFGATTPTQHIQGEQLQVHNGSTDYNDDNDIRTQQEGRV
jgi:hypothetical protein